MGNVKPIDRRILRTRGMIGDAFLDVLAERSFDSISVLDVAERANINRSTFYAHYRDKEELLESMIEDKLQLLTDSLKAEALRAASPVGGGAIPDEPDSFLVTLFQHIFENGKFYRILFSQEGLRFAEKLYDRVREGLYTRIAGLHMEQKLLVQMDILLDYSSSAIVGIARKWLENGMVYSAAYMALQLSRIAALGTDQAMGVHMER
ncbi:TetR/AcrR family transcriptional regulator [Cohnella massiliensis]|uniref:TetR/AcrR family transcriptional regulator n=1 Tax=Cohnella massiliensis TaxID=1816691 RepID=UPI0009BADA15|nr:TetR/AcrR family transcriptional regulator [Cohnella massiliensis]